MQKLLPPVVLAATLFAMPAQAEVKSQSALGFVSGQSAEVLAKPDDVWKRLIAPKEWWNPEHSWSGKTDGFYIDAQANGCFCETFQEKAPDGEIKIRGSVEHMRVIYADPGKVLRMQGALGPLQSEAVLGTLTVAMEPLKDGAGTRLSFNYTVGGYTRFPMDKMAVAVDAVMTDQFNRLIKPLGKIVPAAAPDATEAKPAAPVKADAEKTDPVKAAPAKPAEDWKLDPKVLEETKADPKTVPAKPDDKAKPAEAKPSEVKPVLSKPSEPKPVEPKTEPKKEEPAKPKGAQ